MKTQTILLIVCSLSLTVLFGCKEEKKEHTQQESQIIAHQEVANKNISEEKTAATPAKQETKQTKDDEPMNLLDTQAKVYTDIFGKLGGVEELQGIEGYMDLVNKMDATPETKKQLTEQYKLYSNSIDPEKKEQLKAQLLAALKSKN